MEYEYVLRTEGDTALKVVIVGTRQTGIQTT